MSNNFPHDETPARVTDRVWWNLHGNMTVVVLVLIAILCGLGTLLYQGWFTRGERPASSAVAASVSAVSAQTELIASPQMSQTFYFAWSTLPDKASDIFFLSTIATSTQPINLTNTPDYSELLPAPSPVDARLAYFLISPKDERSLRVMSSDGENVDATYYVGASGLRSQYFIDLATPAQWSPDGVWLAFLGRTATDKPLSSELFVADVQHSTVYRLTHGGGLVTSMSWDSSTDLIYTQQGNDGSLAISKISVVGLPQPVTPVPISSLPQK